MKTHFLKTTTRTEKRSNKKIKPTFITDYCVWDFTKPISAFPPHPPSASFSYTFTGPPTRSRLEEQQLMGVLQPHDQQRSQSADESQTKPREGPCGMLHITSICSPEADWVTEQCSGNITKTLLNVHLSRSLSLSLSACPFIFPLLSISSAVPSTPPPPMSQSQLSVLPKSNSCCGVR